MSVVTNFTRAIIIVVIRLLLRRLEGKQKLCIECSRPHRDFWVQVILIPLFSHGSKGLEVDIGRGFCAVDWRTGKSSSLNVVGLFREVSLPIRNYRRTDFYIVLGSRFLCLSLGSRA